MPRAARDGSPSSPIAPAPGPGNWLPSVAMLFWCCINETRRCCSGGPQVWRRTGHQLGCATFPLSPLRASDGDTGGRAALCRAELVPPVLGRGGRRLLVTGTPARSKQAGRELVPSVPDRGGACQRRLPSPPPTPPPGCRAQRWLRASRCPVVCGAVLGWAESGFELGERRHRYMVCLCLAAQHRKRPSHAWGCEAAGNLYPLDWPVGDASDQGLRAADDDRDVSAGAFA